MRYHAVMRALAQIIRICLVLAVALALSLASATRTPGGMVAGWVVLCAGDDVVAVAVDAGGTPVTPHAHCPDCIMAGAALAAVGPDFALPAAMVVELSGMVTARFAPLPMVFAPEARGPPAFV